MESNNSYTISIKKRQDKQKQDLITIFKEMPIIEVAVKRAGISRDTYYRWKRDDAEFREQSEDAIAQGTEFINDMSESQLIALIKDKRMPAIALWLRHNNPKYGAKVRLIVQSADTEGVDVNDPKHQKIKQLTQQYEEDLRRAIVEKIHEQPEQ